MINLHYLQKEGEQIIDLEGHAHHKGSAFGALGESEQPTTEQFENNLGKQLSEMDINLYYWFMREDYDWFDQTMPEKWVERNNGNKNLPRSIDWRQQDKEWAKKIKIAHKEKYL